MCYILGSCHSCKGVYQYVIFMRHRDPMLSLNFTYFVEFLGVILVPITTLPYEFFNSLFILNILSAFTMSLMFHLKWICV